MTPDDDISEDELLEEIEEEAAKEAASRPLGRRLKPAEWKKICVLWERGEATAKELCAEYGVSKSALFEYFKRNGIVWKSKIEEVAEETTTAASATPGVSEFILKRQARVEQTKEQHYEYHRVTDQLIMQLVVKAARPDPATGLVPGMASVAADLKALRQAKAALSIGRRERLVVLGAENEFDERELASLTIEEKSDAEIRKIAASEAESDDEIIGELETLTEGS